MLCLQSPAQDPPAPELAIVPASPFARFNLHLHMEGAGEGLKGLMLVPPEPGPHPLVVMLHTFAFYGAFTNSSPTEMIRMAEWFASRGYAVAIVNTRGFSKHSGQTLHVHSCTPDTIAQLGQDAAREPLTVIQSLRGNASVDLSNILLVGEGMGGTGELWLTAQQVPGVKGVVLFNPGPWMAGTPHCVERGFLAAFTALGAHTKVPGLWFAPQKGGILKESEIEQVETAFRAGGGDAELHTLAKGEPINQGNPAWSKDAEAFLARLNLPYAVQTPVPQPELPEDYDAKTRAAFETYIEGPPSKAFAADEQGHWGYSVGWDDAQEAKQSAVNICHAAGCRVIAAED